MNSLFAMFPGQGSQAVGMGKNYLENEQFKPLAEDLFAQADDALGFSLSQLCLEGPEDTLTLTQFAQPAILTVSTIAFRASGKSPKVAAGHSLGEYSALVAANAITFSEAVKLVHNRGKYMQEAVEPGAGKMIAVLGMEVPELEQAISRSHEGTRSIANINCPGQIVVAGSSEAIDELSKFLLSEGKKVIELKVSAPFHCRLMKPAADKLAQDISKISFKNPEFPVYSNVTAEVISSGDEAKKLLIDQVCAPVRWSEIVTKIIERNEADHAIEFGHGNVLAGLFKRINKGFPIG